MLLPHLNDELRLARNASLAARAAFVVLRQSQVILFTQQKEVLGNDHSYVRLAERLDIDIDYRAGKSIIYIFTMMCASIYIYLVTEFGALHKFMLIMVSSDAKKHHRSKPAAWNHAHDVSANIRERKKETLDCCCWEYLSRSSYADNCKHYIYIYMNI